MRSASGYMKMGITARGHRLYGAGLTALLGVGMTAMGVYLLVTQYVRSPAAPGDIPARWPGMSTLT